MSIKMKINDFDLLCEVKASDDIQACENELNRLGWTFGYFCKNPKLTFGQALSQRLPNRYALQYGEIDDLCLSLTAVWKGKSIVTKKVSRAATGPDLKQIFIGSQNRYGRIVSAILRISPLPEAQQKLVLDFSTPRDIRIFLKKISNSGLRPLYVERVKARIIHMELIGPEMRLRAEMTALKRLASSARGKVTLL